MNDQETRQALLDILCARPLPTDDSAALREKLDAELAKPDEQVDWDQVDRWVEEICRADGQAAIDEIPSPDALIAKAKAQPQPSAGTPPRSKKTSRHKRRTLLLIAACSALLVMLGVAGISAENPEFFLFEDFIQWTSDGIVFNFKEAGTPTTRPVEEVSACKQELRDQVLEKCGIKDLDIPAKLLADHTATVQSIQYNGVQGAFVEYKKGDLIVSCKAQPITEQDNASVKLLGEYTRGETFTVGERTIYFVQKEDKVAALYVRNGICYLFFSDYDWDTTKDYLNSLSAQ